MLYICIFSNKFDLKQTIRVLHMLFIFSTPVIMRHLWQLNTVVFLHRCLICTVLLQIFSLPEKYLPGTNTLNLICPIVAEKYIDNSCECYKASLFFNDEFYHSEGYCICSQIFSLPEKYLPGTNTQAYFAPASVTKTKHLNKHGQYL